ncbi:MAG: putative porin [Selenomonas sp.]|jgi:hypothetical protein|nr:putative porin [Selenomonas sp.]
MKKKIKNAAAAAAMLIAIGNCQTGFTSAFNPFADVPAGNWSYDEVGRLVHEGYVSGVDDNSYKQQGVSSRQRMAELVARAMSKRTSMNAADCAAMDRLVKEYSELRLLGVEDAQLGNVGRYEATKAAPTETLPVSAEADKEEPIPYNMQPHSGGHWYDNFSVSGKAFVRFERADSKGITFFNAASHGKIDYPRYMQDTFKQQLIDFDIWTKYKFNDTGWFFATESEFNVNYNDSGRFNQIDNKHYYYDQCQDINKTMFEAAYLEGPITKARNVTLRTGRYELYTPQGLVFDSRVTGTRVAYQNKGVGVTVDVGRATENPDEEHAGDALFYINPTESCDAPGNSIRKWKSPELQNIMLDTAVGHGTNLHTSFTRVGGNIWHGQDMDPSEFVSIGIDTKLNDRLKLSAAVAHSNTGALTVYHIASWPSDGTEPGSAAHGGLSSAQWAAQNTAISSSLHTAWMARLVYGPGTDVKKKGSFDLFALYRRQPRLVSYDDTDGWYCNMEGFRLGGSYSFGHNIMLSGWYTWARDIDTKVNLNSSRVELAFMM